jgi:site-specific recombinase XerD
MKPSQPSTLAQGLHRFFRDYLVTQRAMSPHTLQSYRDSLKLLLQFAAGKKGDPSALTIEQITSDRIAAFLNHLEDRRKNQTCTRNIRLSAIHSFFRYFGSQYPEHLGQVQRVLGIPFKRTDKRQVHYFEFAEIQAVMCAIDRSARDGRRDFCLLNLMFNTGARVSEIVGIRASDLRLTSPATVLLRGKGRRERLCPLWPETARLLVRHLEETGVHPDRPETVFRNHCGTPLTRFGVRVILRKYVQKAAEQMPALNHKRLHPHCLRHSTAVYLLRSGVDLSTIAHWLGHSSTSTTNIYLTIDLEAKREALAKMKPLVSTGRRRQAWRHDPNLIAWLESL